MKIKCPSCSAVLNIPDSAAGKIVKCPCGKQLRAPGGAAQPAAQAAAVPPTPARATPQRPAIQRPASASTAPAAAGGGLGFDGGLFDELTDTDLQPVAPVSRPGKKEERSSTGSKLLQQYAGSEVETQKMPGSRPGTLTFLGVINGFWTFLSLSVIALALGLASVLGIDPEMLMAMAGEKAFWIAMLAVGIYLTLQISTTISCFVSHWICWQVVLFAYGFNITDRVMGIAQLAQDEMEAGEIVKASLSLLAAFFFFAYLHTEEVREFYRVGDLTVKKVIAADLAGLLMGLGLGAWFVFG